MQRRHRHFTRRTVLFSASFGLWIACQPPDSSEIDEPGDTEAETAWVEGLQAARQERAELTEEMQSLFQVSLAGHAGSVVELTLANLGDRDIIEYGGLLHLRDPEGERVCTLWLSESDTVPGGESPRRRYDVDGTFATDEGRVSELRGTWGPYRLVFADGEVMAKPWPTQSWWPWCQSYLSRRAE